MSLIIKAFLIMKLIILYILDIKNCQHFDIIVDDIIGNILDDFLDNAVFSFFKELVVFW